MNNWDGYFLDICKTISTNSKCFSRQIGAVIVKDKSIVSTGYNGPPRNVDHCSMRYLNDDNLIKRLKIEVGYGTDIIYEQVKNLCPRRVLNFESGKGLEYCDAGHAERNCIVNAARLGVSVNGGTLYCNCPIPCSPCLVEIINAGIVEIIVTSLDSYDEMGKWLVDQSKLKVRKFEI